MGTPPAVDHTRKQGERVSKYVSANSHVPFATVGACAIVFSLNHLRTSGDEATRRLVEFLRERRPDLLIVAGDIGAGDDFGNCLKGARGTRPPSGRG